MLAADYALVNFVKEMTAICRGKAYFTSTEDLGQYILVDFLKAMQSATQISLEKRGHLCSTDRFDISRQNACADNQN